ncbi:MAG TPA: DUF177 domain-containing protein [Bryobacteraceae bacterium]|nr:DUF177 domain-containing protein [Bryobacteraceae bacterium]
MFLSISEMQLGRVRFSETFAPGAIDFFDPQLRQTAPIVTGGAAQLTEATMEIVVSGQFSTTMEVACDRCLEPAAFPVDASFTLSYRPSASAPSAGESAIHGPELEVGFYEGDGIELSDVVREEILLLMPMQRVCREDCKGICPVCGQNRNLVECHCRTKAEDDRWAGLRNL